MPEHQRKHCVGAETKQRRPPSLVETPHALSGVDAQETVGDAAVQKTASALIDSLIVETRRDDVEWRHEENDDDTAQRAGCKSSQPAVMSEHLRTRQSS